MNAARSPSTRSRGPGPAVTAEARIVPILDALASRGHHVAVRTRASEVGLMSQRGFDAAPIAPSIEAIEHDDYGARTPPAKLKRGMATFGARAARGRRPPGRDRGPGQGPGSCRRSASG